MICMIIVINYYNFVSFNKIGVNPMKMATAGIHVGTN
jgi:hypothetical protein